MRWRFSPRRGLPVYVCVHVCLVNKRLRKQYHWKNLKWDTHTKKRYLGDKGRASHSGSSSNHLAALGTYSHYSYTFPYTSPRRKVCCPSAWWVASIHLSVSIFLSLFLPPALLIPDSFPGHYFWTSCPCHCFFYPSPAALLSHGLNISSKPQSIKLTHFSFAKSHFLSTRPRSKSWTHFHVSMLYFGSLKITEKSSDGNHSKSCVILVLNLIIQASHCLMLSPRIRSSTSCVSFEIRILQAFTGYPSRARTFFKHDP